MKTLSGLCLLFCLLLFSGCDKANVKPGRVSPPVPVKPIIDEPKKSDIAVAIERARRENKFVMLRFTATWCGPCRQLETTTLKDPAVSSYLDRYAVQVTLDGDTRVDELRRFRVNGFPSVVLLDKNGGELGRIIGYRPPLLFLSEVKRKVNRG